MAAVGAIVVHLVLVAIVVESSVLTVEHILVKVYLRSDLSVWTVECPRAKPQSKVHRALLLGVAVLVEDFLLSVFLCRSCDCCCQRDECE